MSEETAMWRVAISVLPMPQYIVTSAMSIWQQGSDQVGYEKNSVGTSSREREGIVSSYDHSVLYMYILILVGCFSFIEETCLSYNIF